MAEQTIDKISLDIQASTTKAVNGINKLIASFENLDSHTKTTITNLKNISTSMKDLSKPLTTISSNYKTTSANLKTFSQSVSGLNTVLNRFNSANLTGLKESFKTLNQMTRSSSKFVELKTNIQQLNRAFIGLNTASLRLPSIIKNLANLDLKSFDESITHLASILVPFNNQLTNLSNVVRLFGSNLGNLPTRFDKLEEEIKQTNVLLGVMASRVNSIRLMSLFYTARNVYSMVTQTLGYFVNKSNEYTENINLFNVAMGEYATTAEKFINQLNNLGVDPAEATKQMGLFYQISHALGLSAENAYTLSENFTKLTYDLASFYNISTESAFEKLRAGLVGETEPLRCIPMAQLKSFERYQRCA